MRYIDQLKHEQQEIDTFIASLEDYIDYEGSEVANELIEKLGKGAELLLKQRKRLSDLISQEQNAENELLRYLGIDN